MQTFFKGGERL